MYAKRTNESNVFAKTNIHLHVKIKFVMVKHDIISVLKDKRLTNTYDVILILT